MKTPGEMKERFEELASKEGYVDGIHNYCDRWCERCAYTSKCRNYAFDPENNKIAEEDTFEYLKNVFATTRMMIEEKAEEMGIDLSDIEEYEDKSEPFRDPLTKFAKDTASWVHDWIESEDSVKGLNVYNSLKLGQDLSSHYIDSLEVVLWYNFFIPVKLERAVSSAIDNDFIEYSASDRDGSAKVALIALDRSIAAWSVILGQRPEYEETILKFLIKLSQTRTTTEKRFPDARTYIRAGLDE